jgi:hypothetical protein
MTHSPANAEKSGSARKNFIAKIREAYAEYRDQGLGATAAMSEIGAALRELDRRAGK